MEYKKDENTPYNSENSKNTLIFRLFEKDSYLLFIYKKLERIVSAFYLVSNLLSDNEPVKWQFRSIGVSIISQALSLTSNLLSKSEVVYKLNTDLVKLLSLLDVSYVAGLVSEMNFTLLKKELEQLLETLNIKDLSKSLQVGKKNLLDKEFFAIPPDQLTPSGISTAGGFSLPRPSFPGQDSNKSEAGVHTWSDASQFSQRIRKRQDKGREYLKDRTSLALGSTVEKSGGVYTTATHRQTLIIELLKNKNNLTINDFSLIIKGCSGKTIQRELLKLVKLGVLKKEGERRWSRYSLATL